ncbi:MAG: hypothetical protein JWS08_11810 [Phormidium sp. PBR-2020]|nr:MAG: hypothetical protein JWS08_11810 [Phormidium sp. PBR-2020]
MSRMSWDAIARLGARGSNLEGDHKGSPLRQGDHKGSPLRLITLSA